MTQRSFVKQCKYLAKKYVERPKNTCIEKEPENKAFAAKSGLSAGPPSRGVSNVHLKRITIPWLQG